MPAEALATVPVFLGLGSNISPEENLLLGVRELRWRYGQLDLSPVYRSRAVGFDAPDFLNMVVGFETGQSMREIREHIELIHELAGRDRGKGRFSSRPLDIDLLLYGDTVADAARGRVPRPDVLEYAFVLKPLADIAPELVHPETGTTVGEHWRTFAAKDQSLTPVLLEFPPGSRGP